MKPWESYLYLLTESIAKAVVSVGWAEHLRIFFFNAPSVLVHGILKIVDLWTPEWATEAYITVLCFLNHEGSCFHVSIFIFISVHLFT